MFISPKTNKICSTIILQVRVVVEWPLTIISNLELPVEDAMLEPVCNRTWLPCPPWRPWLKLGQPAALWIRGNLSTYSLLVTDSINWERWHRHCSSHQSQFRSSWFWGITNRVRPRFFAQVGHQTTNASIGNKDFFTK